MTPYCRIGVCRLPRRARGHVYLDQHSRPGERGYDEKRAGRLGCARIGFRAASAGVEEIANIGHVGDDLIDVLDRRTVLFEQPLDLVPGIAALGAEIAEMA